MRKATGLLPATLVVAACGGDRAGTGEDGAVSGAIAVDGSSTVYPITEAVAEEFGLQTDGGVRVTVGVSGTGGGFKRFCAGETDISNASRPNRRGGRAAAQPTATGSLSTPAQSA